MMRPFTIVSLWQVIQLDAPNVLHSYSYLGAAIKHLEIGRAELLADGDGVCHMGPGQLGDIIKCSLVLGEAAKRLDLAGAKAAAARFHEFLMGKAATVGVMSTDDLGRLTALGSQMLVVFSDELEGHLMFVLPSRHASFYSLEAPFGAAVADAFPSAAYDIVEAAKCRSLGRWTASVMHLMRALEVGLAALARHVGVDPGDGGWNTVLNQIETKARAIGKRSHGKDAEQWAAEAASHLRFVKNAWRNHAMHPLEKYDEDRAVEIFDNAQAFMRHLATKLHE